MSNRKRRYIKCAYITVDEDGRRKRVEHEFKVRKDRNPDSQYDYYFVDNNGNKLPVVNNEAIFKK